MSGHLELQVCSLRSADIRERTQLRPHARLSDRILFLLKAAVLAAILATPIAWRTVFAPWAVVSDANLGVALRYPADWHARGRQAFGVAACELLSDAQRPGPCLPPPPTRACSVVLERFTWVEYEAVSSVVYDLELDRAWRTDERRILAEVGRYLGMHGVPAGTRIELAGRPGAMLLARRGGGWGAAVVAPALDDFVVFHLYAPTERDLRRVWRRWTAMAGMVELRDPRPRREPCGPPDQP